MTAFSFRRSQAIRRWLVGWALLAPLFLSGCITHLAATRMVEAPNRRGVPKELRKMELNDDRVVQSWRMPVGPPTAELSVGVIDPGAVEATYRFEETPTANGGKSFHFSFEWKWASEPERKPQPALKGTLVLLHGIMMSKETMLPWAFLFAQEGYRVVVVDLRGHGHSTGEWMGYGAWEAADLVQLTDELQRRGLIVGKLGVFGISYGAVMAIHWAARDPRVTTVVALAPFSDPQKAIVEFARGALPHLSRLVTDADLSVAETKAARMAGFQWSDVSVVEATKRLKAPILFFHGEWDGWISPQHSAELLKVSPPGSRRELVTADHRVLAIRLDKIGPAATRWFDEKLGVTPPATRPVAQTTQQVRP